MTDPLKPGLDRPTPAHLIAQLNHEERTERVRVLVEQAHFIARDALRVHLDGHRLAAKCLLWSGGRDSNTLAHVVKAHVTHAIHANTGIGVEETREHVRATCAAWQLPLLEYHPPEGSTYRDLVLDQGFPGPGQHYKMYQRLKERALHAARNDLISNPYKERVLFVAGRRRSESERRTTIVLHERNRSIIWVSPMANWTTLDMNTYRRNNADVPHNSVTDILHMSGECLCGAFANKGELDHIRQWYPAVGEQIDALGAEALAAGVKPERCRWGWGAYRDRSISAAAQPVGELCSSCEAPE